MLQLRNTLYVTQPDISLHLEGEALRAVHADGREDHIPLHELESIVCFSYHGATSAVMRACAEKGIGLFFLSQSGRLQYRVIGQTHGNVLLRKRLYLLSEQQDERIHISRELLCGKLAGARELLGTSRRSRPEEDNAALLAAEEKLLQYEEQLTQGELREETMRGVEGAAAGVYFQCFPKLLRNDAFTFDGRNRRPPKDPCNALLSFAYTLLTCDCTQALECAGLDPYVGFLHTDRPGKPSLSLDLSELFRAACADRFVLKLINLKMLAPCDFLTDEEGGCRLTPEGRKLFVKQWNMEKKQEVPVPELQQRVMKGLLPHLQACALASYLRKDTPKLALVKGR